MILLQPVKISEGGFQRSRYEVAPIISDAVAREFIEQHPYGWSYPAARFRYGLYEGSELVGVVVLGVPSRNEVLTTVFPI